ncbi:hypothetical protein ETB97_003954 [Aspergillus alliaceus]|uniref:Major facilitator superfamily (MFS) profile domain-containing protein n=1 Tax=Petromyces alliaceus TaxID=209559 RepID=A0A8H6E400_PETAA|nr:hypothetical protein ETB97_003954 [Aspergillus burnettii]
MTSLFLLLLSCLPGIVAEIDSIFRSRPDLYPPVLTIEHSIPERLASGYIFLGLYEAANSGPYIYDDEGVGLVLLRPVVLADVAAESSMERLGELWTWERPWHALKTVVPGGGMASSDMHEFLPINGGKTALLTVYQQRQFDMSLWNVRTGMGWVMESIFQEVDVETNEVLFEWKSLDHVDPTASYTWPGHTDTSGTGLDSQSPWDYFHINSIDKNKDGDYLISSRHTCAIYKISGQNGSVIWQLHGANPSFTNINFSFSQQHDARWLNENGTHTLLSLYNNGYNGFNKTHEYSSGMLILIDHVAMTATQLQDYAPLNGNMLSSSQGNMQVLPNRNVFIGWGNNAYISEHDQHGNLLLWGYIDKDKIMNYRAQKFKWDGNPTDVPALWTYSQSSKPFSSLTMYVSWNGATRVRYWRFYGSLNMTGPYALLNQVTKKGFETSYSFPHYYPWTYAEAVDPEGKVLGKSRLKFTFTPSAELQQYCTNNMCENAQAYGLPGEMGALAFVPPAGLNTVPWVDPEHPEAHYDWGESTEPESSSLDEAKETLKAAYGELSLLHNSKLNTLTLITMKCSDHAWVVPLLAVGIVALGLYVVLRRWRRTRHHVHPMRERASSEPLDDGADQRRRRESNISLDDVSEGSSDRDTGNKMALRNTSFEQPGHARNRSQSQNLASFRQPQHFSSDPPPRPGPVTWMTLPRKKQLALLGLCRVFDFLQIASLQAYMFYQLKSFDDSLSDADVSTQAGILQGAFTAAQFATAIPWGRVADAEWGGRKFVLLVGLLGTAVSCLGVAFATSFAQAVFWRSFGGAINGTVGIIRTMIAENVKEKKYHSRAFLILPIGFNIASLFGPVMGGMLSDPVRSYPALFGPNSSFGGANGIQWLERYPYALPMLANAVFLSFAAFCVGIGLEETLDACKGKPGLGLFTARIFARGIRAVIPSSSPLYQRLPFADYDEEGPLLSHHHDPTESYELEEKAAKPLRYKQILPFHRLWTKNVLCTLLAQAFFDFQMGAFNNLWLLFLSSPRYDSNDPAAPAQRLPFIFTGGLGMLPQSVGFATAILGIIGMLLQFTVYPAINSRLGTAKSYQYFLTLFPLAYAFAPYIALAPSSTPPPGQANGPWVWFSIIIVLFLQVSARTFTLPTSIILLNNCSPHPSVLGTIHGIGQSVSSAFRTIGPIFSGSWYGYGLEIGMVGFAWWLIALVSVFGCVAAIFVYEGSGHEILLPGEEDDPPR